MKILAFGDLHGHPHRAFATYEGGMCSRLKNALDVLDQVRDIASDCDLVLFAGDLFHAAPPPSVAFNTIYEKIGEIAEVTPIGMIAGNHDLRMKFYKGDQNEIPFLKLQDVVGVTLLETAFPEVMQFPSRDGTEFVSVFGVSHRRLEDTKQILRDTPVADICLLHQDVLGASVGRFVFPAGIEHEETSKFNWTLCGHIHQPQKIKDRFVILGAPLHINFSDEGDRGVWVLDTKAESIEMIPTTFPRFVTVGSEQEVSEDGNFYRVAQADEKKTEALRLPGLEESVTEYVKKKGVSKEHEKVGLSLVSFVSKELAAPSDFRLHSVSIENFTVFEKDVLHIGDGLHLVVGDVEGKKKTSNGSGKTSLFEAISWALYGLTSKGEKGLAVMRRGLNRGERCRVEVMLQSPTRGDLVVAREQSKSGSSLMAKFGDHVEEGDVRIVQKWLVETLGVSYEFFRQMVYFSQDSVDFFSSMGDADKKRILSTLLGLGWYDDAHQFAKGKRDASVEIVASLTREAREAEQRAGDLGHQIENTQRRVEEWEKAREGRVTESEARVAEFEIERKENSKEAESKKEKVVKVAAFERLNLREVIASKRLGLKEELESGARGVEEKFAALSQEVERELEELAKELSSLPSEAELQTDARSARDSLGEVEERWSEASTTHAREVATAEGLRDQVKDLEKKMGRVERLEGGTKCPTCGADVTPESKDRCVEEIKREVAALRKKLDGHVKAYEEAHQAIAAVTAEKTRLWGLTQALDEKLERRRETARKVETSQRDAAALKQNRVNDMISLRQAVDHRTQLLDSEARQKRELIDEKEKSDLQSVEVGTATKEESLKRCVEEEGRRCKELEREKCPLQATLTDFQEQLEKVGDAITEAASSLNDARRRAGVFVFWVKGFGREGIPAALLVDFCRLFTAEVNDVLSQMNVGISVELSSSTTLKSGELRDRLDYIIRTRTGESTYRLLSGGEKTRVDLTSMLVLNLLASRQFNIQDGLFGVLILDEVFSSLDTEGCELVYEILGRFQARSIFVISHSSELKSLFDSVVQVRKTGDVSVIV